MGCTRQDPGSGPSRERPAGHPSVRSHPVDACPHALPTPTQGTQPAGQPRPPRSASGASRVKRKRRSGRDANGGGDGRRGRLCAFLSVYCEPTRFSTNALNKTPETKKD